jgi:hypothetical protein
MRGVDSGADLGADLIVDENAGGTLAADIGGGEVSYWLSGVIFLTY